MIIRFCEMICQQQSYTEKEDKASMKQKNRLFAITKMLLLLLTLVLPWTMQERALADSGKGSIRIDLKELQTPKNEVAFKAYEVGTWNGEEGSWQLDGRLTGTGISLKDLVYASDFDKAALELSKQAGLDQLLSASGKTDANGSLTFSDLDWGMYLVVQDGESEYGTVAPFLASLPYIEDGVQKSDLTVQPKAEPPLEDGNGRIEVTKRVGRLDETLLEVVDLVLTEDVSYYVGIFKDQQGRIPYGTDYIKQIPMKGISQGTAVFENLPAGTYYIFETDKDGNAYQLNERQVDQTSEWICKLDEGTTTQEVTIDGKAASPAGKVGFYNQYYDMNDQYYYVGTLYISKKVMDGEDKITVPEKFYAGIFKDKAGKELYSVEELQQNGTITVELPLGGENGNEEITYYVYETDKDGNRVAKDSFGYTVSGEGKAELRSGNWEATISLVNSKKADAEESSSEVQTEEQSETTISTRSVRTGDDTPITLYLITMAAALLVLILGMVFWRGHRRHER